MEVRERACVSVVGAVLRCVAFCVAGISSGQIERALADRGIGVGSGNFYAHRCIEALGIDPNDGVVRVSMVHYNTEEEVQQLLSALDEILERA